MQLNMKIKTIITWNINSVRSKPDKLDNII